MFHSHAPGLPTATLPAISILLRSIAVVATLAALSTPIHAAEARTQATAPARTVLDACRINGQLVLPALSSGKTTAWIFVTNLDQPLSQTTVRGCMAVRTVSGTSYTPGNYCAVMNNTAKRQFGNGSAQFDNNAYLQCAIPNPPDPAEQFWVHARTNFPTTLNGDSYTLINSSTFSFTVNTNATCLLTLNSRYNDMLFSHSTINQCGSFVELNSNLVQTTMPPRGLHRIGLTSTYGPTDLAGSFGLPANLNFTIGAIGESFTLDYLVIDPPGSCCNPK